MNVKQIILSSLFLFPMMANAEIFADSSGIEASNYFGISFLGIKYEEDALDFHETGMALRLGHEFNSYFGIEGRLGTGLTDDKKFGFMDIGVDSIVGIYARGSIFLWSPRARLYALVGATRGKITAEAFGLSDTLTDTEIGFGLGVEMYGNSRNAINLELMRYMDGEDEGVDYTLDAFSIGYVHRF
jgi:hypothetical protein